MSVQGSRHSRADGDRVGKRAAQTALQGGVSGDSNGPAAQRVQISIIEGTRIQRRGPGVGIRAGKDLSAGAGLRQGHAGGSIGNDAGISVSDAGSRIEGQGGHAGITARDHGREIGAANKSAEGWGCDAAAQGNRASA